MKMDIIAGSKNDEFYTPEYAVIPLLKYLKKDSIIWCPFDTIKSNFVKLLSINGFKVFYSHIKDGMDFFEYKPNFDYDYIISNPPYSLKGNVLNRLFEMKKSFAMLVGVVGLFESKIRFNMFKENNFEIMYFDKRVAYFKNFEEQKPSLNPPFSSVYVCQGILPKQIMFEEITKKIKN